MELRVDPLDLLRAEVRDVNLVAPAVELEPEERRAVEIDLGEQLAVPAEPEQLVRTGEVERADVDLAAVRIGGDSLGEPDAARQRRKVLDRIAVDHPIGVVVRQRDVREACDEPCRAARDLQHLPHLLLRWKRAVRPFSGRAEARVKAIARGTDCGAAISALTIRSFPDRGDCFSRLFRLLSGPSGTRGAGRSETPGDRQPAEQPRPRHGLRARRQRSNAAPRYAAISTRINAESTITPVRSRARVRRDRATGRRRTSCPRPRASLAATARARDRRTCRRPDRGAGRGGATRSRGSSGS